VLLHRALLSAALDLAGKVDPIVDRKVVHSSPTVNGSECIYPIRVRGGLKNIGR
jgi:hypothetical protein